MKTNIELFQTDLCVELIYLIHGNNVKFKRKTYKLFLKNNYKLTKMQWIYYAKSDKLIELFYYNNQFLYSRGGSET